MSSAGAEAAVVLHCSRPLLRLTLQRMQRRVLGIGTHSLRDPVSSAALVIKNAEGF